MQITPQTQLNLIIGNPLTHSQSPLLHHAVYSRLGINAILLAKENNALNLIIDAIKALSVRLTAVTRPYKEKIVTYIDYPCEAVKAIKAANTLICCEGKIYGYNTDIDGIEFALRGITVKNKKVLVIGAGGTAKSVSYYLKKMNATLLFLNRTHQNAMALAKQFSGIAVQRHEVDHNPIDIIINTTPVGLYPKISESPLSNYRFNKNQVVFDVVYHPMDTIFLKQAKKDGAKTISGMEMFIGQGLKQIELFTGKNIYSNALANYLRKLLIKNQCKVKS